MILDFETYCLNEATLRTLKKTLHGVLGSKDRATMKKLLRKYVIHFKFKKKNGDMRRAVGTLISSYLPALRGGAPKPEHQMVYYDLEKEHWRSFRSFSFIKILDVKTEDEYVGKKSKKKSLEKDIHKEDEKHVSDKHEEKDIDKHEKHSEHVKKSDDEDIKKKEYKVGEKIPEKELMRRSTDFRHGSKKNRFTKKSNDAHKKGDLDDKKEDTDEDE